jgi:hypothetical protein
VPTGHRKNHRQTWQVINMLKTETVKKQSGKKTASVATGPIGNATSAAILKYADTLYYQIDKHGDYIQETN